jgi:small subunit ribosomal protein S16
MALKIRLRQQGRTNRAFFRIVLADCRSPRDGKYVEALGWYNPIEADLEKSLHLNQERITHWLSLGAQMTENLQSLIARIAPGIVRSQSEKIVERRAKANAKRKARKKAAAAK